MKTCRRKPVFSETTATVHLSVSPPKHTRSLLRLKADTGRAGPGRTPREPNFKYTDDSLDVPAVIPWSIHIADLMGITGRKNALERHGVGKIQTHYLRVSSGRFGFTRSDSVQMFVSDL